MELSPCEDIISSLSPVISPKEKLSHYLLKTVNCYNGNSDVISTELVKLKKEDDDIDPSNTEFVRFSVSKVDGYIEVAFNSREPGIGETLVKIRKCGELEAAQVAPKKSNEPISNGRLAK